MRLHLREQRLKAPTSPRQTRPHQAQSGTFSFFTTAPHRGNPSSRRPEGRVPGHHRASVLRRIERPTITIVRPDKQDKRRVSLFRVASSLWLDPFGAQRRHYTWNKETTERRSS